LDIAQPSAIYRFSPFNGRGRRQSCSRSNGSTIQGDADQPPAGYTAQIVPGADGLHPILKIFSAPGTELAAGAYPAAILADLTNGYITFWGADFK